jgi:hypothetical protein
MTSAPVADSPADDVGSRRSLADGLRGHANSLGVLRLVFASAVIFSHAFYLIGAEHDPLLGLVRGQESIGGIAVLGFFAISGYLIVKSGMSTDALQFIWRRALRIFPAFWTVLVVSALVVGPVAWVIMGRQLSEYFTFAPGGPASYILGPAQMAWLKRALAASRATWKVIAADMPIGLVVTYDGDRKWGIEGVAQGDGPARGRELEIADVLTFIKRANIRNTVWLTADVHYTAAHYYDPNRAVFQDFEPFWEFVSGPIHAGTFGPNDFDMTFGPELKFIKAPTAEQGQNLPPSAGLQFFGLVDISGASEQLTVRLMDRDDNELYKVTLDPVRGA